MLPLLGDADLRVSPVALGASDALSRANSGLFLLAGSELEFDPEEFRRLVVRISDALAGLGKERYPLAADAGEIGSAVAGESFNLTGFLEYLSAGAGRQTVAESSFSRLNHGLLMTLGRAALRPALRDLRKQLAPLVNGSSWDKGKCLVCGSPAVFSELRGNNQSRHLRCGQCGADWPVPRLKCMDCGNEDHASLGVLYLDRHDDQARVEVCNKCRGYIKVISSFEPMPPEMLPVEDLATLRLDYAAVQQGYSRGGRPH